MILVVCSLVGGCGGKSSSTSNKTGVTRSATINNKSINVPNVQQDTICSTCYGVGSCKECYGSGSYRNPYVGGTSTCVACGGSGRCRICGGRGRY